MIQSVEKARDIKEVKPDEITALMTGLADRKALQWRSNRLDALKRNSVGSIVINDPILKQIVDAQKANAEKAATQRAAATSAPAATNPK